MTVAELIKKLKPYESKPYDFTVKIEGSSLIITQLKDVDEIEVPS
jgi:hypothetical protein